MSGTEPFNNVSVTQVVADGVFASNIYVPRSVCLGLNLRVGNKISGERVHAPSSNGRPRW